MADAKRCDRCLDFYMPDEEFIVPCKYSITCRTAPAPDLCKACYEELELWMANILAEDPDEVAEEVPAKVPKTPHMSEIPKNNEGKYHKQKTGDLYKNSAKIAEMTQHFMVAWKLDAVAAKQKAYYVVYRAKYKKKPLDEYFEEFKDLYRPEGLKESPLETPVPISTETPYEHLIDQPKAYRARLIEDVAEKLQEKYDIDWGVAKSRARLELIKNEQSGVTPAVWYRSYFHEQDLQDAQEIHREKYTCAVCQTAEVGNEGDICDTCIKHMENRGGQN